MESVNNNNLQTPNSTSNAEATPNKTSKKSLFSSESPCSSKKICIETPLKVEEKCSNIDIIIKRINERMEENAKDLKHLARENRQLRAVNKRLLFQLQKEKKDSEEQETGGAIMSYYFIVKRR